MDSDLEFCELRTLTQSLLNIQNTSTSLSLVEKITLSEHLRYCFYKLSKFACPKSWTEAQRATVALLEMMQPDLKFDVPSNRIRHKLCPCISESERKENMIKANELANLMCSSRSVIDDHELSQNESTPLAVKPEIVGLSSSENAINEDLQQDTSLAVELEVTGSSCVEDAEVEEAQQVIKADTVDEIEAAMFNSIEHNSAIDSDEELDLPETVTDVSIVRVLTDGHDPPPKLGDFAFAQIASLARADNFDNPESITCDFRVNQGPRKMKGVACVSPENGQLTVIRPRKRVIMKGYAETKSFSAFLNGFEDSIANKQDLYELLCLYYWFKNVVRNKGVHQRNWMEIPLIFSKGDDSLQAKALRAIPISYLEFATSMV